MDLILEVLRLVEALPAIWEGLLQTIRDLAYALLPPELDTWLAANEWLLLAVVLVTVLFLVLTLVGTLAGGD